MQSRDWGKRPSELLAIDNTYIAYCVDEAVYQFGTAIEAEVNGLKRGKKEKDELFQQRKRNLFLKLLEASDTQRFAPIPGAVVKQ